MTFFIVSFKTSIKRLFKPSYLIIACVLAAALMIGDYLQKELFLQARVGVYYNVNSKISQEIIGNLETFSNIGIKQYDDINMLLDDVISMKVECGYVFDDNIDEYIKSGSINRGVTLYKSEATLADSFTNELVFAALMKTAAPYVSANYLTLRQAGGYDEVLNGAFAASKEYYESGVFMELDVINIGGGGMAESPENTFNAGIVSVFLFIAFFYITISGIEEKKTGLYEKLSRNRALLYLLSYVMAHAVMLFALVSVLFVYGVGTVRAFAVTGAYIAFLSAACFAAASALKSAHALYALFPIISIIVIMLGGAFFDIGAVSPELWKIPRLLPTYYYVIYVFT